MLATMTADPSNTSGQGPLASVPGEVDRWNWGAFLLNWIWGIGNNTFIALLMFVPFVNVVMAFVLGAKGSSWAWRNKRWDSVQEFRRVQRLWALWGVGAWALFIALFVAGVFSIGIALKGSDAYKLAVTAVQASNEVADTLGQPLTMGRPSGSLRTSGSSGTADLSFSVEGPKGRGTVFVDAVKDLGRWEIRRIVLQDDRTGRRIDLGRMPA